MIIESQIHNRQVSRSNQSGNTALLKIVVLGIVLLVLLKLVLILASILGDYVRIFRWWLSPDATHEVINFLIAVAVVVLIILLAVTGVKSKTHRNLVPR